MVPASFSRTIPREASEVVMIIRMRPSTPGNMKFRLLSSGLYQTLTSELTVTGLTPDPLIFSNASRMIRWVYRPVMMAA